MAKLDVPTWGGAATVVSAVEEVTQPATSEDEAKKAWMALASDLTAAEKAWMAKLDDTTWGKAAETGPSTVAEAAQMALTTAACEAGDEVACDELSREEEAKRAWMANL